MPIFPTFIAEKPSKLFFGLNLKGSSFWVKGYLRGKGSVVLLFSLWVMSRLPCHDSQLVFETVYFCSEWLYFPVRLTFSVTFLLGPFVWRSLADRDSVFLCSLSLAFNSAISARSCVSWCTSNSVPSSACATCTCWWGAGLLAASRSSASLISFSRSRNVGRLSLLSLKISWINVRSDSTAPLMNWASLAWLAAFPGRPPLWITLLKDFSSMRKNSDNRSLASDKETLRTGKGLLLT